MGSNRGRIGVSTVLALCAACTGRTAGPTPAPRAEPVPASPAEATPASFAPAGGEVRGEVRALYRGSPEAPIAALRLGPRPKSFFDDPREVQAPGEDQERLGSSERITLSRDRKRELRSTLEPDATVFRVAAREVRLAGRAGLALDSAGRTSVAWTRPDESDGTEGELVILGAEGEDLFRGSIGPLDWVEVAANGERVALGEPGLTRVIDRRGEMSMGRLPRASLAAFSPDGTQLALETTGAERRFVLARTGSEIVGIRVPQPAVALVFDGGGTRLARVTPRALQIYRLEGEVPVPEPEIAPPPGFSWRSAAFSREGRLAAGRIEVVTRPARNPSDPPVPDTPGKARLAIDVFPEPGAQPVSTVWEVTNWNHRAPEVAFGEHALYAVAWPSAFEVSP